MQGIDLVKLAAQGMARSIKRAHRRRVEAGRRQGGILRRSGLAAGAAVGAFALSTPAAQAGDFEVNVLTDGAPNACDANCTLRDALTLANASAEPDNITFLSSLTGTIHLTQGQLFTTGDFALTIDGPGAAQLAVSGDADNNGTGDSRILQTGDNDANDSGTVSIEGLTLTKGTDSDLGGAIFGRSNADINLTNTTVTDSSAGGNFGGGGVYLRGNGGSLTITNSNFSGNTTTGSGGGVQAHGPLTISGSTFSNNTGDLGAGGISVSGNYAPFELSDSTITGNHTPGRGGGVVISQSAKYDGVRTDIVDTTISGNDAATGGAGVFVGGVDAAQRVKFSRTTISGNDGGAGSFGGGIWIDFRIDGDLKLVNSTVSGNTAEAGGGVSLGSSTYEQSLTPTTGVIELNNSTIARNTATSRGGGIYLGQYDPGSGNTSATVPLNSTIVADNQAAGSAQDLDRVNTSGGGGFDIAFSLIERKGDAPLIQSPPGSNILGFDPQLGPLANNGGATRTHKPSPASKAVDRGDSSRLATDQRGGPRLVNLGVPNAPTGDGTDIGAVELRASELPNNGKCAGKQATIIGDSKVIRGTNGPDVILGTNGKNVIRGRGGKDFICGLGGNDRLIGGGGPDRLLGGGGRDTLIGGPGRDKLKGGPGPDVQRQ
jgi:hypothetical protein